MSSADLFLHHAAHDQNKGSGWTQKRSINGQVRNDKELSSHFDSFAVLETREYNR